MARCGCRGTIACFLFSASWFRLHEIHILDSSRQCSAFGMKRHALAGNVFACLAMLLCTQKSSAYNIMSQPYSLRGVIDLFSMTIYGFNAGGTADMEVKVSMANPRVATYNAMMQYNTATNPNNYDRTMFFVSVCPYPTFRKAVSLKHRKRLTKSARSCTILIGITMTSRNL